MFPTIAKPDLMQLVRLAVCLLVLGGVVLGSASPCFAQAATNQEGAFGGSSRTESPEGSTNANTNGNLSTNLPASLEAALPEGLQGGPEKWTSPEGLSSTLQVMLLLTVLSLAPAILLMTTSFVRIVVVLSLLRQAIGTQQLPPSQVITSLSLFISLLIMTPTWKQVYNEAVVPYTEHQITLDEAWQRGVAPIRQFMTMQIERTGNSDDVHLFLKYIPQETSQTPQTYDEVPMSVLLPAFVLSELKTAFLIGFQIFLPFLILDMVVASVMVSMGMMMLPPVLISLPFKLLLFVLLDGWTLVVSMLLDSFAFITQAVRPPTKPVLPHRRDNPLPLVADQKPL